MSSSEFLSPVVTRAINAESYRAWPSLRRFGYEPADVQQEFRLHALRHASRHDERRSSLRTFVSHLCRNRKLQIVEAAMAVKRNSGTLPDSLSEPVKLHEKDGGEARELGTTVSDDIYMMRTGRRSRPAAELVDLRIDLDNVIGTLPSDLAAIADLLGAGEALIDIAQQLRISRATLHRRIGRLRQIFQAAGLNQYNTKAAA